MVATDVTAEMTETPTTRAVDAMIREKIRTSIVTDAGVATAISEATETGTETIIGIRTGAHGTTKTSTQRGTEDISDRRMMTLVETHGARRTRVLAVMSTTIAIEPNSARDLKRALTATLEETVVEVEVGVATGEVVIEVASEEVVEVVLEIGVVGP